VFPIEALRYSRSPTNCLIDALATVDANLDLPELLRICSDDLDLASLPPFRTRVSNVYTRLNWRGEAGYQQLVSTMDYGRVRARVGM